MTTTYRLSAPSAEQLHDLPVHTELRLPSMPSSPIVKTRTEDGVPWLASVGVERRLGREVTASWYGSGDLAAAIGDGIVEVTEPPSWQELRSQATSELIAAGESLEAERADSHAFRPVAGHPDDDECTYRHDGTDWTYCGVPEADHR